MALEFKKNEGTYIGDMDVTSDSSNVHYKVTYRVLSTNLQSVSAEVFEKQFAELPGGEGPVMQEQEINIGNIAMEYGTMRCDRLTYSEKLPLYMTDFIAIVNEIVTPAPVTEPDPVEEV